MQGQFRPKNPQKYVGDPSKIVFRSSWEMKAFRFLDEEPAVLNWASEELHIPYIGLDGSPHRYFVDLIVITKNKKLLVEIKPFNQTQQPRRGKKREDVYLNEVMTYHTNQLKWKAAEEYAAQIGFEFVVWTEKELGIVR